MIVSVEIRGTEEEIEEWNRLPREQQLQILAEQLASGEVGDEEEAPGIIIPGAGPNN